MVHKLQRADRQQLLRFGARLAEPVPEALHLLAPRLLCQIPVLSEEPGHLEAAALRHPAHTKASRQALPTGSLQVCSHTCAWEALVSPA